MVAGGMESMTNAPHDVFARKGIKYGAATFYDHMAMDGLEDAYERGKAMGVFAEQCVARYQFSREALGPLRDQLAQRGEEGQRDGSFAWEIARGAAGEGGRDAGQGRRAALQGAAGQDPPQAGVQEGRHDHRRQQLQHQRRRRRAGADARRLPPARRGRWRIVAHGGRAGAGGGSPPRRPRAIARC